MIPRVFVSSTIRDLQHIRDAVRDIVGDLGYQPVMSEHGEVGLLPSITAVDACYNEAGDCDLGILIIGKRYGGEKNNNISVTHQEYRTLHEKSVPIITLIERDLFSSKAIFEANDKSKDAKFPGMDRPSSTFNFINEIMNSPYNNGVSEFRHVSEVRDYIKAQVAHIFGDLLRRSTDSKNSEMKDILSAISSLRHELLSGRAESETYQFLRASRALLGDNCKNYKEFLTSHFRSFDPAVQAIIENETFDELMKENKIIVRPDDNNFMEWMQLQDISFGATWGIPPSSIDNEKGFQDAGYVSLHNGDLAITNSALNLFRANHRSIRAQSID